MDTPLDISDVIRRTGLTARALRFYEARGLVQPLRTASGRRLYGPRELTRLSQLVVLKAAGFSLADIGRMLGGKPVDLARLIGAQLSALEAQAKAIDEARRLLLSAQSRVDRGEPLDAATLCSLIKTGDRTMSEEDWKAISDRYWTDEAKADFAANPPPAGFDQSAYSARWADLAQRIEAALPLDPASPQADAFYLEWQTLLVPIQVHATPEVIDSVRRMYDHIDDWKEERQPPFSSAVWMFIQSVAARQPAQP